MQEYLCWCRLAEDDRKHIFVASAIAKKAQESDEPSSQVEAIPTKALDWCCFGILVDSSVTTASRSANSSTDGSDGSTSAFHQRLSNCWRHRSDCIAQRGQLVWHGDGDARSSRIMAHSRKRLQGYVGTDQKPGIQRHPATLLSASAALL